MPGLLIQSHERSMVMANYLSDYVPIFLESTKKMSHQQQQRFYNLHLTIIKQLNGFNFNTKPVTKLWWVSSSPSNLLTRVDNGMESWIFFDFFALQTNFRENREAAMPIHHLNKMESGNRNSGNSKISDFFYFFLSFASVKFEIDLKQFDLLKHPRVLCDSPY